jgi:dTDP-4-dehydrorhamnose 3,5-epimerase
VKVFASELPGVMIVELAVHADARGWLCETFQRERYAASGITAEMVQDNWSSSSAGVLRGLHYQLARPQGKLVSCTRGKVFDVAVDIRRGSPTFGRWVSTVLSEDEPRQVWIPPGFAHGFLALSERADVHYKCTAPYDAADGRAVRWDDRTLAIAWPAGAPVLSATDAAAPALERAELPRFVP